MTDAHERAAFITGADSGIGRATVRRLGRDGYMIGAFDLDADGVQGTVESIVSSRGQAVGFIGDVRDDVVVLSALESLSRVARLWLVANVAGIGAFIASRDGRFINGSEFVMDGGMTAR